METDNKQILQNALNIYKDIEEARNGFVINTFLKLCLHCKHHEQAVEIWDDVKILLKREDDSVSYPLLLSAFGRCSLEYAQTIFDHIPDNHKQVDKQILNRFWKQQFEQQQQSNLNCKRWINALKEKIPTGQYNIKQCLQSFNKTIVNSISDNLGHIVATRKRESTIDVHRAQMQYHQHQQHQQQHQQAMDIDK